MRSEGTFLLIAGVATLALYGDHLLHRWWPSDEVAAFNGSALSRMILGNQRIGKEPSDEALREFAHQRRLGRLVVERVIPMAGFLLTLSGISLVRAGRSVEAPPRQRISRVS